MQQTAQSMTTDQPDYSAIKSRQQTAWGSGDYARIGVTLQITGEELCEAMDLRAGQSVLDVAAGNGNATLAAARRFCRVVATDYVPALLERSRVRAEADGLAVEYRQADAEALPFADSSFDNVVSTFGVMFTPDQPQAAAELIRVCRPGGRIGMANWTPEGFIGQLFKTIGRHVAPPPGIQSPAAWGTDAFLNSHFARQVQTLTRTSREFMFRYQSAEHWLDLFATYYGPVLKAFEAVGETGRDRLRGDLLELVDRFNRADDGTMVVPGEYLQIVITR